MIGQPLPRLEDRRFVTGNGRYTDDIDLDGQAYAVFLRSAHAHARIRGIDAGVARQAPGVVAVLTGADYVADGLAGIEHRPNPNGAVEYAKPHFQDSLTGGVFDAPHMPLAIDKVRYVGEAVAVVIAETTAQARDAAELIEVDYEPLPAVVRADDAMRAGAPQLWEKAPGNLCFQVDAGEGEKVRRVFAAAPHVVRREFRHSRVVNCQMEPRAAIGAYDPQSGVHTLISGSQGVSRQKANLTGALKASPDKVRVVAPDTGGGFGPRTMMYVEQVVVVWAARRVGRPVKWTGDRSEAFIGDYQGRDAIIRAAMALDDDGRILATDYEWIGNVGGQPVSYTPLANGTRVMTTVYHVPAARVLVSGVLTNTVPTVPYRGAGRPEATHVMERMLDLAAARLGVDRVEIRRRNIVGRERLPYLNPMGLTYDSGDFAGNMERALELGDWAGYAARREASKARGRLRGIAVANYVEAPVGAPRERIRVALLPDGKVDVVSGTQSTGQGHETSFAQVLASTLGVPVAAVRLRTGDTDFVTVGGGTHSDRSMRLVGTLLVQASSELIESGRAAAARLLGADAQAPAFRDGVYEAAGGRRVTLTEVAADIAERGMPDDPAQRRWTAQADFGGRIPAHPTGAVVCELEVDPETGDVQLLDYTSVDDVGRPINPLIVEGQVHGGLAQGIGQALSEGYCVDATGQVLSGSYMDYGVPRAGCIPPLRVELREDPTLGNPLGVKGGGESGITPATAVIFNALADALRDYGDDELPMPATAAAIWQYIHRKRGTPSA